MYEFIKSGWLQEEVTDYKGSGNYVFIVPFLCSESVKGNMGRAGQGTTIY